MNLFDNSKTGYIFAFIMNLSYKNFEVKYFHDALDGTKWNSYH